MRTCQALAALAAGVRYAWAGYPEAALRNKAALAASPFIHPSPDFDHWPRAKP
jgi:hypothetical protein